MAKNNLTGLIPILYAAAETISRELVGSIVAATRYFGAEAVGLGQTIRVPVTPTKTTRDILPGQLPPAPEGTNFGYTDMIISKNKAVEASAWTGDEELSVGSHKGIVKQHEIEQSMRVLVNEAELDLCVEAVQGALEHGNYIGVPGTTPFGVTPHKDFAEAVKFMDDMGSPKFMRNAILNTAAAANLRGSEKLNSVAHSGTADLLRQGVIGDIHGFAIRESAGLILTSAGSATSVTLSAAANPGEDIIAINALSGSLNKGALITLGGKMYVVKSDYAAGTTQIAIGPAIIDGVTSGSTGTVVASYLPSVMFTPDFLYSIVRPPARPEGGDSARDVITVTDPVSGLTFQAALYEGYYQNMVEIGLAWGQKVINPRHGLCYLG